MILSKEEFEPAYEEAKRTVYGGNALSEYSKEELMALIVMEQERTSANLLESQRTTSRMIDLL